VAALRAPPGHKLARGTLPLSEVGHRRRERLMAVTSNSGQRANQRNLQLWRREITAMAASFAYSGCPGRCAQLLRSGLLQFAALRA